MIRRSVDAIYQCVAGLDVHQKTVVACRRRLIGEGQAELEIKTFQTTSAALRELAQWLSEWQVTQVAMESIGIYWIPVWNVLEGQFKLTLTNAQHLNKVPGRKDGQSRWVAADDTRQKVPGRKDDQGDAEWIA